MAGDVAVEFVSLESEAREYEEIVEVGESSPSWLKTGGGV